jgi:hypothetical protein
MARLALGPDDLAVKRKEFDRVLKTPRGEWI